jgi:hypothetical protein
MSVAATVRSQAEFPRAEENDTGALPAPSSSRDLTVAATINNCPPSGRHSIARFHLDDVMRPRLTRARGADADIAGALAKLV